MDKLTLDQVCEILETSLGATGCARLWGDDLMVRREDCLEWSFCGSVWDINEAAELISSYNVVRGAM